MVQTVKEKHMALTAKKLYAILKRQISDMEAKLNSPVRYRGTVATADLLPLNPDIGDMYNIESKSVYGEAGMNVAWNGVVWDTMGAPIDMSLYLTKEEAESVIQRLVTEYFEKNPVKPGATTEQTQQIEQNKTDIGSLKKDFKYLSDSYVTPEMFGAVGDGVTDDTNALFDMFEDVYKTQRRIILGKSKTYVLRSGLNIGKICQLEGNNSTFLIDRIDVFSKINGNFTNQLFMDNGYNGEIDLFNWNNINIILTPQLITNNLIDATGDSKIREYIIFGFGNCKEFAMNNCKISLAGNEKNKIVLFKFRGCGKIFINNCNFKVVHRGETGSLIWIQSDFKGGYYVRIKDSYLYDTCHDELISVILPYKHDIVIENCTLEKKFYPSYYTNNDTDELYSQSHFMFTDSHKYATNTVANVDDHITKFKKCNIICKPIEQEQPESDMFFIGGSNKNLTYDFVKFDDCNIELQKLKSFGYGGYNDKVSTAVELEDYSKIIFNSCNIKISTIVGAYGWFYPLFWSAYFVNCFIECQEKIFDNFYQFGAEGSTPFTIYMTGNRLRIKEYSNDVPLFSLNKIAKNNIVLNNNEFIVTDADENEITPILYKYMNEGVTNGYSNSTVHLYNTAKYRFYSNGNRMNYKSLETIEVNEGETN